MKINRCSKNHVQTDINSYTGIKQVEGKKFVLIFQTTCSAIHPLHLWRPEVTSETGNTTVTDFPFFDKKAVSRPRKIFRRSSRYLCVCTFSGDFIKSEGTMWRCLTGFRAILNVLSVNDLMCKHITSITTLRKLSS